ncbi:MAG: recombination mediator RecR, partial [Bacillota bacterium]
MRHYPQPMGKLIGELSKLPGIGPKTAQRLAFYILGQNKEEVNRLSRSILEAKEKIKYCSSCNNLTEADICDYCSSDNRNETMICVVESPKDVIAMEKTGEYHGLYHVLHGSISPM